MNRTHVGVLAAACLLAAGVVAPAAAVPVSPVERPPSDQSITFVFDADGTDVVVSASDGRVCAKKSTRRCKKPKPKTAPAPIVVPTTGDVADPAAAPAQGAAAPTAALDPTDPHADAYAFLATVGGQPVHWNTCTPITVKVNPARMPDGARADIDQALAQVSAATGATFVDGGPTDVVPYQSAAWTMPLFDENVVFIAFANEGLVSQLGGSTIGIGGNAQRNGVAYIGGLTLDTNSPVPGGFGKLSRGTELLHELGHVMGLAHIADDTQMMNPILPDKVEARYGQGDLHGLAQLRSTTC